MRVIYVSVVVCWLQICNGSSGGDKDEATIAFPDDLKVGDGLHHHHHHHYHHGGPEIPPDIHYHHHERGPGFSPNIHHHHHEEKYPTNPPPSPSYRPGSYSNSDKQIPLDFIQDISLYNVSDLLINFVEGGEDEDEPLFLENRFNGEDGSDERSAAVMPKEAGCMPELKTIKIASSDDPSVLYIPQCTRVERCGGCCSHSLLACQPTQVETISYKVIKTQYTGAKKLKFVAKEIVPVEKHLKCKCDCKVRPEDCNQFQVYKKSECRCACNNMDEEKKCYKSNDTKLWNPELCVCQCRDTSQCSTGFLFDQNECKCKPVVGLRKRYATQERKGVRQQQLPVVPLFNQDD